jgi:hypothetical protein
VTRVTANLAAPERVRQFACANEGADKLKAERWRGSPLLLRGALRCVRSSNVKAVEALSDAAGLFRSLSLDHEVDDDLEASVGGRLD